METEQFNITITSTEVNAINATAPICILSVEAHPVFREGLTTIIESQPDMHLIAHAGNGIEAIDLFRLHRVFRRRHYANRNYRLPRMHHQRHIIGTDRPDVPASNTARPRPGNWGWYGWRLFGAGAWMLVAFVHAALAVDPTSRITQYAHTAWRIQNGVFTGAPTTITQTNDGYIWIGTLSGLVRFDGVRFVPWTPPEGKQLPSSNSIYSLLADRDGSLWIGTGTNLAHWVGGDLIIYGNARGRINAIRQDGNGTVWLTRSRVREATGPLCEVRGAELLCHGSDEGFQFPYAQPLALDNEGNLWIGSSSSLTHWRAGSATAYTPLGLVGAVGLSGVQGLAAGPDGTLWVGMNRAGPGLGLQQFRQGVWTRLLPKDSTEVSWRLRPYFSIAQRRSG